MIIAIIKLNKRQLSKLCFKILALDALVCDKKKTFVNRRDFY